VAAEAFDLTGVGGVDFIVRDGVVHPIEVNPRWTASMELVERAHGLSLFDLHAAACVDAAVPASALPVPERAYGKAVVFAKRTVRTGDTRAWLADGGVRDVPRAGTTIVAGHPVCTVLASAAESNGCYRALVARAEAVYADLARWRCVA
jgi:predicted ATP-grasp superfamily ATP-dependent carboligase